MSKDELLSKARKPSEDAMRLHPFYQGKYQVVPKAAVRSFDDFAIWYSPGVAAPCMDIRANPEKVYEHTAKGNTIAVVSDGTRVLGLGDIGPEAALPVMEGKAMLFKYLGGVDAVPICLKTTDPEEIISAVKWLQPSFGGINLEDISQPKCFDILDRLREECEIPVWHDDQQGTAAVILAAFINAVKLVGKSIGNVRVAMVGAGAANVRTAHMLIAGGVDPEKIIMCDSKGTLHKGRHDLEKAPGPKWGMCQLTNGAGIVGGIDTAMAGADAVIGCSQPGPGVILPEWVRGMASDPIVFACANPVPEIWPWEAQDAGAAVFATGRSDFPNQANNSLGFPAIFRGALDVRATAITDEMCIAAARELAAVAEEKGLRPDYIIPTMDEWEIYPREAAAVGTTAIKQGVARRDASWDELLASAERAIRHSRGLTEMMMKEGFIALPPDDTGSK
jgi:malate dehydrogenase (oxaloacetate-decarboxylating)